MANVGALHGVGSPQSPGVEVCHGEVALIHIGHSVNVLYICARVRSHLRVYQFSHHSGYGIFELIISTGISIFRMSLLETQD